MLKVSKQLKLLLAVTAATIMVFATVGGVVGAFPEDGKVGQPEDHDGTVTRVEFDEIFTEDGTTWHLVMPYRGDFGDTSYLNDGWIMNVYTDRQGNFVLYVFVHETDPRYSEDLTPIFGSWAVFKEMAVGRSFSAGR